MATPVVACLSRWGFRLIDALSGVVFKLFNCDVRAWTRGGVTLHFFCVCLWF